MDKNSPHSEATLPAAASPNPRIRPKSNPGTHINKLSTSMTLKRNAPKPKISQLCSRCEQIDFNGIFNTRQSVGPLHGRFISTMNMAKTDSPCHGCQLLDSITFNIPGGRRKGHHLRLFRVASFLGRSEPKKIAKPTIALSVLPGTSKTEVDGDLQRMYPDTGFMLPRFRDNYPTNLQPAIQGCRVDTSHVDYERILMWLRQCDHLHSGHRGTTERNRRLKIPLSCIDCLSGEVARVHEDEVYFALSYVWGSSLSGSDPQSQFDQTTVLPRASRVINDAINVVKALGKRYLWVDQFCVDQVNPDIKNVQIQEMDCIYAGAYATIVACAGADANYGLSGVSHMQRERQPSIVTSQMDLFATLPSLHSALKDTTWTTRGWTYQEAMLSRRCLFFTKYQVYFACPKMICCEAVTTQDLADEELPQPQEDEVLDATIFFGKHRRSGGSMFRSLADHITEYSGRSLTYQTDVLKAFSGILSRSPFHSFYGIPIAPYDQPTPLISNRSFNIGFARGLWWVPNGKGNGISKYAGSIKLKRRTSFPSWSWVGWHGSVKHCGLHGILGINSTIGGSMEVNENDFDTQFWLETDDRQLMTFENAASSTSGTKVIPELTFRLIIEARVIQFQFWQISPMNDWTVSCTHHFTSTHTGTPGKTNLTGYLVRFGDTWIGDESNQGRHKLWDCIFLFESTSGYMCFMVIDWEGDVAHQVGVVELWRPDGHKFNLTYERKRIRMK